METNLNHRTRGRLRRIQITPELVRQVSERVFALLLAELKIERERRRAGAPMDSSRQRGS